MKRKDEKKFQALVESPTSPKRAAKSMGKFARASARKNLLPPPRTRKMSAAEPSIGQSVDVTPTADAIDSMATEDTATRIADADSRLAEQTAADYANAAQTNDRDPDLGVHVPAMTSGDQLAGLAANLMARATLPASYTPAPSLSSGSVVAALTSAGAFGPRK